MEARINRPGFRCVTADSLRFTAICICQFLSLVFAFLVFAFWSLRLRSLRFRGTRF